MGKKNFSKGRPVFPSERTNFYFEIGEQVVYCREEKDERILLTAKVTEMDIKGKEILAFFDKDYGCGNGFFADVDKVTIMSLKDYEYLRKDLKYAKDWLEDQKSPTFNDFDIKEYLKALIVGIVEK